jgi:filamentous hemagglutinin family protein
MRGVPFLFILTTGLFTPGMMPSAILLWSGCANAQVTSDGTLPSNITNLNNRDFVIDGGSRVGNNLFHSFSKFSIPTGGSASFNNGADIKNIFSRVTGGAASNIDGLIKANFSANLFLLNPSGILFGQNASLNIGGSFVGTTANSIKFSDGVEFSAVNITEKPLLTMNTPIGLQMGQNPRAITVKGSGHNLIAKHATFSPYVNLGSANSLQVKPSKTLALIGGDIQLDGAILQAPAGRIELASLGEGDINLIPTLNGFKLDDPKVLNSGNIQLSQRALVDVSSAGAGSIKIQSNQISVKDGSVVMVQNRGIQSAGDIEVKAAFVNLNGAISDTNIRSSFVNETLAGNSGNININTEYLKVENGAGVFSRTFGLGTSSLIDINATKSVDVLGFLAINPNLFSSIGSATFSQGNSGNINLLTPNLSVSNGGVIVGTTFGTGSVGTININSKTTQVTSSIAGIPINTAIAASTYGKGDGGKIILNTQTLLVEGDANITTTSYGNGNSGSININATESLTVNGRNATNVSRITASVVPDSASIRQLLGLPRVPAGNAGNITIKTPYLKLSNYGNISVRNEGTGNAGTLTVNADLVELENNVRLFAPNNSGKGGNIFVEANSLKLADNSFISTNANGGGNGGNITINLRDSLVIRGNSQINTNSLGKGNGGNIIINAPFIIGLKNSDIIANAVQGNGGNIQITTQGIFGLAYSPQLTENNDINASSEFGVNGRVDINNFGVDPSSGLVKLPEDVTDSSQQIASGCSANQGSSFVATGRGGIPQNPNQEVRSDAYDGLRLRTWSDTRDISAYRKTGEVTAQIPESPEVFVQATDWRRNAQGKIELFAAQADHIIQPSLTCAAVTQS